MTSKIGEGGSAAMSKSISEADDQSGKQAGDTVSKGTEGLGATVASGATRPSEAADRASGKPAAPAAPPPSGNAAASGHAAADPNAPRQ